MTLDKISVYITSDDPNRFEGYLIEVKNKRTNARRSWRADLISNKPNSFLFYRYDSKPTTRTHEVVDLPGPVENFDVFSEWVDEQLENMAQGVM